MFSSLRPVFGDIRNLLAFRATREEMLAWNYRHFFVGLFLTWLVGLGRAWDNPGADIFQALGAGSVVYVFVMPVVLWLTTRDLMVQPPTYWRFVVFLCLVSPPGFIYAIPVEKFLPAHVAAGVNVAFLVLVAAWRVALLVYFLRTFCALSKYEAAIGTLVPLSLIMSVLGFFHIVDAVFSGMAGIREGEAIHKHDPNVVIVILSLVSMAAVLPLLMCHESLARHIRMQRRYNRLDNETRSRLRNAPTTRVPGAPRYDDDKYAD